MREGGKNVSNKRRRHRSLDVSDPGNGLDGQDHPQIHKKKRGFATKKEALQWERDFISQSTGSLGMTFGDFIALYVKDMEHRLKPSTVASKKWLIDLKVTPFFKKIPLNEIKPTHVRQWQNSLTSYRDENGKPYA